MRKADNLPPFCAVTKSRNLNFLEPSGPVQACNGTALPLRFYVLRNPQFKFSSFLSNRCTFYYDLYLGNCEMPVIVTFQSSAVSSVSACISQATCSFSFIKTIHGVISDLYVGLHVKFLLTFVQLEPELEHINSF